ncbi:hypothetical protein SO802_001284 [Lithocarpus litseifolius]|uniref:DUF4283 domain-containing protein n=1 Tax=Lithocarpus litseifolius TaxID=425828 RepID=A0AAW2DY74_9ROSI
MEDLAEKWSHLTLSERENTGFVLQNDQQTGEFIIAAQFLTPRFLNMEILARTFKQLWRSTNGFRIRNQKGNRVLFVFDNVGEVDRILKNQPWSFDKHLVMLQRYNSDIPVRDLVFQKTLFWVQVHDIPMRFMKRKVAEEICDTIGEVQKSTGAVDEEGGHFIRVCVLIDISLPLCRGRLITAENGGKIWIRFKYERLPNFCFWCGRLNHSDKNCELWLESKGTLTPDQQQFNSNLRAAPYTSAGKDVIYVPGIYERAKPRARAEFHSIPTQSSSSVRIGERVPAAVQPAEGMTEGVEGEAFNSVDGETLQTVDGVKEGEVLEINCVEVADTLQTTQGMQQFSDPLSPPINAPNNGGVIMASENLIPKPVPEGDLVDIKIGEIDEALNRYGNNAGVKGIQSGVFTSHSISPANQTVSEVRGKVRQVGTRVTRRKKISSTNNGGKNKQGAWERAGNGVVVGNKNLGKRKGESHLELPSKHQRVSKDEGESTYSMVEAEVQPRQSQ